MNYCQCILCKFVDDDTLYTVAWIPEKFSKSKILKLKEDDGSWSDGWYIGVVYSTKPEEFVLSHQRDFTKQREASDI
jgi:hypothetical protein